MTELRKRSNFVAPLSSVRFLTYFYFTKLSIGWKKFNLISLSDKEGWEFSQGFSEWCRILRRYDEYNNIWRIFLWQWPIRDYQETNVYPLLSLSSLSATNWIRFYHSCLYRDGSSEHSIRNFEVLCWTNWVRKATYSRALYNLFSRNQKFLPWTQRFLSRQRWDPRWSIYY